MHFNGTYDQMPPLIPSIAFILFYFSMDGLISTSMVVHSCQRKDQKRETIKVIYFTIQKL